MKKIFSLFWRNKNRWLIYSALILITLLNLLPIALTALVSFKSQEDVIRTPPVLFPCDTPTQSFDLNACRWSLEGYERVLAPRPSQNSPFGFELIGTVLSP